MSKLEKIAGRNSPESLNTPLAQGLIVGWIPGEITDLRDPEGLGRIQVRSDVIAEDVNLPNSSGMATVMEEFVCNAQPGGAHKFLQVGTQVAMLPMLGSASQLLIIGCLPSRVDRPHPELNRANQLYGTATPGQVFKFNNDREASSIQAYPHGVVQHVSGQGDLTMQTEQQASMQLNRDGTAKIENPKSSTVHAPDGTISQQNSAGAIKVLDSKGNVQLTSKGQSTLSLLGDRAQMTGPPSKISGALKNIQQQISGHLGVGKNILNHLLGISKDLGFGGDLNQLLLEASGVLSKLETGIGTTINQGIAAIDQLGTLSARDLGEHLLPQIESAISLNLPEIAPLLKLAIEDLNHTWATTPPFVDGAIATTYEADLISTISKSLPPELSPHFNPERIGPVLAGLNHSSTAQVQALIEDLTPAGFPAVKNLSASGLLPTVAQIESTMKTSIVDPITNRPYEPQEIEEFNAYIQSGFVPSQTGNSKFEDYYQQVVKQSAEIQKSVPEKLKSNISQGQVLQTITRPDGAQNSATEQILGQIHAGTTKAASESMAQIKPVVGAATPLKILIDGLQKGDHSLIQLAISALEGIPAVKDLLGGKTLADFLENPGDLISRVLGTFSNQLKPLLDRGMQLIDNLTKSIPSDVKGALIRAMGTNSLASKLLSGQGKGIVEGQLEQELSKVKKEAESQVKKLLDAATQSGILLGAGEQAALKLGNVVLPPLPPAEETASSSSGGIGSLIGGVSLGDVASLAATAAMPGGPAMLGLQAASSLLGGGAGNEYIEALTSKGLAGAHFRVSADKAALLSPRGKTQVFASAQSAGIRTPWGEFGLGEAGGSFFSKAKMVMKVIQAGGGSAGLLLHPKNGVSLSAFSSTEKTASGDPDLHDWSSETARIRVEEKTVTIESMPPPGVPIEQQAFYTNSIVVSPDGVFINGTNLRFLTELADRYAALERRLAIIEASLPTSTVTP